MVVFVTIPYGYVCWYFYLDAINVILLCMSEMVVCTDICILNQALYRDGMLLDDIFLTHTFKGMYSFR